MGDDDGEVHSVQGPCVLVAVLQAVVQCGDEHDGEDVNVSRGSYIYRCKAASIGIPAGLQWVLYETASLSSDENAPIWDRCLRLLQFSIQTSTSKGVHTQRISLEMVGIGDDRGRDPSRVRPGLPLNGRTRNWLGVQAKSGCMGRWPQVHNRSLSHRSTSGGRTSMLAENGYTTQRQVEGGR